jgi:DnaJ-class molecular chaperone
MRKSWNGGSIESAMELARERQKKLIAQGASLCDECNGNGGTIYAVCIQCHGAGVILPSEGLTLEDEIVVRRCSGELDEIPSEDCAHETDSAAGGTGEA